MYMYTQDLQEQKINVAWNTQKTQKFRWKTQRKISANQPLLLHHGTVTILCKHDAFSRIVELRASPLEGQQVQLKNKKTRKKGKL